MKWLSRQNGSGRSVDKKQTQHQDVGWGACSLPVLLFCIAAVTLAILLPPFLSALAAREGSARLVFRKTADSRPASVYTVKKGDRIASIIRSQLRDEPVPYDLIRQLNPGIRDLNRIYVGQKIILPARGKAGLTEKPIAISNEAELPPANYLIREGDSISRILLADLKVEPKDVLNTYRMLRQLNPDMTDPNQLPEGHVLKLPQNLTSPTLSADQPLPAASTPLEKRPVETAAKLSPEALSLLAFIGPVVSAMRGSLATMGYYFIPLKENAQVTIDCSVIPVVELNDGSALFLDFGNSLSDKLKAVIRQSWTNYAFIPGDELHDGIASLQRIISHSRTYSMTKAERPLSLTSKPQILAYPDWIIMENMAGNSAPYRQGLFLLGSDEKPLPADARVFFEKNGLAVTEIAEGRAVASMPAQPVSPVPIYDLRGLKGIAFVEKLLKTLGETPVPNAEVAVFNQARDGFSLSVTADLLLRRGDKRFIIHTKRLPEEFIRVLKEAGTEAISVGGVNPGRSLIESVLQGLKIPLSMGYFSFRIPEEGNRPRLTAVLSALRVTTGNEPLYLVDFEVPPVVPALLRDRRAGFIAIY